MKNHFDEQLIEEIKTRNNIVDVISRYITLKQSGRNLKGLCPFHGEKTPSFMVSQEKQFFHCFGCGQAGDVIHFIMKIENLEFMEAIKLLGQWCGINIEENFISKQEKEEIYRKNKLYEVNRQAALFYYHNLINYKNQGMDYLVHRGLNIDTIKKFGLGYAKDEWEGLNRYLLTKGFDQELIYTAGLVSKGKKKDHYFDKFRNRVIFPIINTVGKVIGFGGRAIGDFGPKYLNSPKTPVFNKGNHLFALNFAKKETVQKKQLIIVEGYMDVIKLYQNGIKNVVASLGTALTKDQGKLLKKYANEVVIAYDADGAGQAATLRGLDILKDVGCKVRVIQLSEGKDPDEFVQSKGKEAFLEIVNKAFYLIDYKMMLAKKECNLSTTEGKIKFIKMITPILKSITSPVELEAYIKQISSQTHISSEAIKSEIYGNNKNTIVKQKKEIRQGSKYRSKHDRYTNKYNIQPLKPILKMGHIQAQLGLLKLMIEDKEVFEKIKAEDSFKEYFDQPYKEIAIQIDTLYEQGEGVNLENLLNHLGVEQTSIIQDIHNSVILQKNHERLFMDYLQTIQRHQFMKQKKKIEEEIQSLENVKNKTNEQIVRIRKLCINYEKLLKELKKL